MAVFTEQTSTGEVRVETGAGIVDKLEHDGKRNAHVRIKATHADLRQPVQAWVDTWDGATWPLLQEAAAERFEVEYRIEVKRKPGVDAAKTIAELGNMEKVRDLAAVARRGELPESETRPRPTSSSAPAAAGDAQPSAPAANGSQTPTAPPAGEDGPGWLGNAQREATEQRERHRAPDPAPAAGSPAAGPRCELCDVTVANNAELVAHGRSAEHAAAIAARQQVAPPAPAPPTEERPPERGREQQGPKRARVEEAKPWVLYNTDGSLNLASWSYQAVVGFVELALELIADHVLADVDHDGDHAAIRPEQVEALARTLLDCADKVQAATRADGHVDRMDSSHTRARGAVRTALRVFPVPFDTDAATRAAWAENLVAQASSVTRIAFDLFRFHETGEAR